MSTVSQYEKYWLLLLKDGKLTIQVPTRLVAGIKKALIARKYNHRLRTGIRFNKLSCVVTEAKDAKGLLLTGKSQLDFHLHNLTMADI